MRWHQRSRAWRLIQIMKWIVIGFIVLGGVVGLFVPGIEAPLGLLTVGVLLALFSLFISPWLSRRSFANRPDKDIAIEWLIGMT